MRELVCRSKLTANLDKPTSSPFVEHVRMDAALESDRLSRAGADRQFSRFCSRTALSLTSPLQMDRMHFQGKLRTVAVYSLTRVLRNVEFTP